MPKYDIMVRMEIVGTYHGVEADSEEKARELAENGEGGCSGYPNINDIVDESLEVIVITESYK